MPRCDNELNKNARAIIFYKFAVLQPTMIVAVQALVYFRESLIGAIARLVSPYYLQIKKSLTSIGEESDDEDDDEVFAEFDEEKGVVFFPPLYIQRYAAVSDCLLDERWKGKLEKIVDLGYHDMSFIKYLKDLPGVKHILGVDLESIPLKCSSDLLGGKNTPKNDIPLQVTLFQGNAADPDYRLIGCDAVVAIEMIEHMLPHDLDRLVHNIFGFIQPWIAVITTPNGEFNVLFKAMEKNGLRRCDHFFEWTREQFHDWCSNIVFRYPQFTVHCQGIGPGPPGTAQYGCCSQMALFVNKCYVKRQDVDINSLALVPKIPTPDDSYSEISGYDTPPSPPRKMICALNQNSESLNNLLSSQESFISILITSALSTQRSLPSLMEYRDQTSQCNMELESAKNFMMFDSEETLGLPVKVPRRRPDVCVYQIEDVNSRLNCSTHQAKKFSKTTQNLIAKNKIDVLAHTREVVSEIRHLTDMLNWKRETQVTKRNGYIWYNINWGEDAPYWNQYYTLVRKFDYPYEVKSEASLILELISEEINRLVDTQPDRIAEEGCVNVVHIPLDHLMNVVRHITSNVDKVRDVLEWNGYEMVGDVVVYSRMAVDHGSLASADVDWPQDDATSEFGTINSTTATSNTSKPADYGLVLRQAIDMKVKSLREMLSADEDITTELDRIVCRLMKLALSTSAARTAPPPTKWMQCKFFDLLTLAERAVSRRSKCYLEDQARKSIGGVDNTKEQIMLLKLEDLQESKVAQLFEKYEMFIDNGDNNTDPFEFDFEDEMGDEFDSIERVKDYTHYDGNVTSTEDVEAILKASNQSIGSTIKNNINRKTSKFLNPAEKSNGKSRNIISLRIKNVKEEKYRRMNSKTNVVKVYKNKTTSNTALRRQAKKVNEEFRIYGAKTRRLSKEHRKLHPTASKPIPKSLIDLCHPDLGSRLEPQMYNYQAYLKYKELISNKTPCRKMFATEESVLYDVTMGDLENKIDIQGSITFDVVDSVLHNEPALVKKSNNTEDHEIKVSNVNDEPLIIFLNDINEPSTSKGIIRHVNIDAQCGTDTLPSSNGVTNIISASRENCFSDGVRIDSLTNVASKINNVNIGTSDFDDESCVTKVKSINLLNKGIKIVDSLENVTADEERIDVTAVNEFAPLNLEKSSSTNINGTSEEEATKSYELSCEQKYSLCKRNSPISPTKNIHAEPDAKRRRISSPNIKNDSENADFENSNNSSSVVKPVHEGFSFTRTDESITNFLINFKLITGIQSKTFSLCKKSSSRTNTDISDAAAEDNATNKEDWSQPSTTGVKVVDLLNDVFIGRNTDVQDENFKPPELCSQSGAHEFEKNVFVYDVPRFTLPFRPDSDVANLAEENTAKENQHSVNVDEQSVSILGHNARGFTTVDSETAKNSSYKLVNQEIDSTDQFLQRKTFGSTLNDQKDTVVTTVEFSMNRVESLSAIQVYVPPSSKHTPTKVEATKETETKVLEENKDTESNSITVFKEFIPPSSVIFNRLSCGEYGLNYKNSLGVPCKLSCACIHIHSYKQSLQDIVYQGEWNQHVEKRKSVTYPDVANKMSKVPCRKTRSVSPRMRMINFNVRNRVEIKPEMPGQVQSRRPAKSKQVVDKTDQQIRQNLYPKKKALRKVSSKISVNKMTKNNDIAPKKKKPVRLMKNTPNVVQVIKNDSKRGAAFTENVPLDSKYLPSYLRKLKLVQGNPNLDTSSDSGKTRIIKRKVEKKKLSPNNYRDNKSSILKMRPRRLNYMVFCNEIEKSSSTIQKSQPAVSSDAEVVKSKHGDLKLRSSSPLSRNNSTSSSILTVKLNEDKPSYSKKSESNKSDSGNTGIESSSSITLNKTGRNNKIKQTNRIQIANKENIAQTSNKCGMGKDSPRYVKGTFTKQSNIYVAQITDGKICGKKPNATESHLKLSPKEYRESKIPAVLRKISAQSNDLAINASEESSNVVLLVERKSVKDLKDSVIIEKVSRNAENDQEAVKTADSERILEWMDSNSTNANEIEIIENTVLASMRHIVEERLNFIGSSLSEVTIDKTVDCFDDNSSAKSFKTVVTVDESESKILKINEGNVVNHSLDTVLSVVPGSSTPKESSETTILDCISYNSVTSMSEYSAYYSADSEGNLEGSNTTCGQENASSCFDLLEGIDSTLFQDSPTNFASQVFSGCSMQEETMIGDQLDYSISDTTRQATSEEMDTSGQSSSSYGEQVRQRPDPVNLIDSETGSRLQGSESLPIAEDDDEQQELIPMPLVQPQLEINGNAMQPLQGLGTGAGDGRGIHSDRSQDSSGRGSSLSSSNDSSGQQSQAILIDPSAFTNEFVLVHEPVGSSMAVTLIVPTDTSQRERNGQANEVSTIIGRNGTFRIVTARTSDGEADVSSTDTDVPDSS